MNDTEIVRFCAAAMGRKVDPGIERSVNYDYALSHSGYDPLHDDTQAMALDDVLLKIGHYIQSSGAFIFVKDGYDYYTLVAKMTPETRRRARCECVAKIQQAAQFPEKAQRNEAVS